MAVLSRLLTKDVCTVTVNGLFKPDCRNQKFFMQLSGVRRHMSDDHGHEHRKMNITATRFQYNKFKDLFHLYTLVGVVPLGLLVMYVNIFIGPAQLAEIPEGYEPEPHEYFQHPITRWMAKYCYPRPQQEYETMLSELLRDEESRRITLLTNDIKKKMNERHDYKAFYYQPITGKYHRHVAEGLDYTRDFIGRDG